MECKTRLVMGASSSRSCYFITIEAESGLATVASTAGASVSSERLFFSAASQLRVLAETRMKEPEGKVPLIHLGQWHRR